MRTTSKVLALVGAMGAAKASFIDTVYSNVFGSETLSQTEESVTSFSVEQVEIPVVELDDPSIMVYSQPQPDLWNDQYLNDPDWMYNNGFTYYYNDGQTYILCADDNGNLSWEEPQDCDAFQQAIDDTVDAVDTEITWTGEWW
jgi:hypothetical protein